MLHPVCAEIRTVKKRELAEKLEELVHQIIDMSVRRQYSDEEKAK